MLGKLWARVKGLFFGLFRRTPAPGRFENDARSAFRGFLQAAPWIWPQREYLLYIPRGHSGWTRAPLLVLLHGCKQTPEEIAAGTRITALADESGCLVLMPRQNPRANGWSCWNWFDPATASGWGETAIVAAQTRAVCKKYRIDKTRVFAAGMSAGAGLASALGIRRPDVFAGIFAHSGVACGAASSAQTAFNVLKGGAETDFKQIAHDARAKAQAWTHPVPVFVVQGSEDSIVAPINASQIVRQYLALNGHAASDSGSDCDLPPPDHRETLMTPEGREVAASEWHLDGRVIARHVLVAGLGHAWSGGDDRHPYNDPLAPDATALLATFIRESVPPRQGLFRRVKPAAMQDLSTHEQR